MISTNYASKSKTPKSRYSFLFSSVESSGFQY
jgi:hypothetical protein